MINNNTTINDYSEIIDDESKLKIRKTKHSIYDRIYKCHICGKSYLSYPALYTHNKNKHNLTEFLLKKKKGRGRPKKEAIIINNKSDCFNNIERIGQIHTNQITPIFLKVLSELFIENYIFYKDKLIFQYTNLEDYSLIIYLKKYIYQENTELDVTNFKCDDIFSHYIILVSKTTNLEYFQTVCKLIILLREYINILKNDFNYTRNNFIDNIPEIINEFVSEFLDFDNSLWGLIKEDIIDLILNFCQWLLEYNYTTLKISLVGN